MSWKDWRAKAWADLWALWQKIVEVVVFFLHVVIYPVVLGNFLYSYLLLVQAGTNPGPDEVMPLFFFLVVYYSFLWREITHSLRFVYEKADLSTVGILLSDALDLFIMWLLLGVFTRTNPGGVPLEFRDAEWTSVFLFMIVVFLLPPINRLMRSTGFLKFLYVQLSLLDEEPGAAGQIIRPPQRDDAEWLISFVLDFLCLCAILLCLLGLPPINRLATTHLSPVWFAYDHLIWYFWLLMLGYIGGALTLRPKVLSREERRLRTMEHDIEVLKNKLDKATKDQSGDCGPKDGDTGTVEEPT